jgi:hypothetical protein
METDHKEKKMINMKILILDIRITEEVKQEQFLRHWELNNNQFKYLRKFKKTLTKI